MSTSVWSCTRAIGFREQFHVFEYPLMVEPQDPLDKYRADLLSLPAHARVGSLIARGDSSTENTRSRLSEAV